jgi:tetratricopeptide (TPR) repeat protein
VVQVLARLVDKSLVIVVPQPGLDARYRMLEPIREFAMEQLAAAGEEAALRSRHLDYYLSLATNMEPAEGPPRDTGMSPLAVELDNIRSALDWAQEQALERGLRLASAHWRFYLRYGHGGEFIGRLKRLLAQPKAAEPTLLRAQALNAAAELLAWENFDESRTLAEESLTISRALGGQRGEAANLLLLGSLTSYQGDGTAGRALIQQSAELYRAIDDRAGLANALLQLTNHTPWEEYQRARAMFDEALQILRERGDLVGLIDGLEELDLYELHCGHLAEARAALEQAVALQRGHPEGISASTLHDLGALALHEGRYAEAREHLEACLHKSEAAGNPMIGNWVVSTLGYIALREGDLERAHDLARCAATL